MTSFSDLVGKTLIEIRGDRGCDELDFIVSEDEAYRLYHHQDCCETVQIEDICGDLKDLIGSPILSAEEVNSDDEPAPEYAESYTWTFYKIATIKGSVTIRWLGTSNGYYSESVDFTRLAA